MKRFLLLLVMAASPVFAQSDVPSSSAFGTGEGVNGEVNAVAIQKDGKVVIGGKFTSVNNVPRNNVARLNSDGTLDRTFAEKLDEGVNGTVYAIAIQPEGGIVVGGNFSVAFGQPRRSLARLNTDGTLDGPLITQSEVNGPVKALAAAADDSAVAGGNFTVMNQDARNLLKIPAPTE